MGLKTNFNLYFTSAYLYLNTFEMHIILLLVPVSFYLLGFFTLG